MLQLDLVIFSDRTGDNNLLFPLTVMSVTESLYGMHVPHPYPEGLKA